MTLCYVFGPSIPATITKKFLRSHICHIPTIRLQNIHKTLIDKMMKGKKQHTWQALILTSKHAVEQAKRLFCRKSLPFLLPQFIICVGQATAQKAKDLIAKARMRFSKKRTWGHQQYKRDHTPCIIVAHDERQEGVYAAIMNACSNNSITRSCHFLWLSSSQARPELKRMLEKSGFIVDQIPVYTPVACTVKVNLQPHSVLFFSCPSSVISFFSYGNFDRTVLHSHTFQAIGPVTQATLDHALQKNSRLL